MASAYSFKILAHSPDRQRVVVWLTRAKRTDKYLVVAGTKSLVWTRTRGRSYIIGEDKCNCPASRGLCKHVLVTAELKAEGFFPEEKWVKYGAIKPERAGTIIRRLASNARDLFPEEHHGQGWFAAGNTTVAVLRDGLPVPAGWCKTNRKDETEFALRCFIGSNA